MANHIYPAYCHDVLTGASPWVSGTLKVSILDAGASYNSANTIYGDVSAHVLTGVTPQTLGTKSVDASANAIAGSTTFSGVTAAQTLSAIVLYIDLGGGVTRLIAWWDTVVGLPLTTTGADITIDWNGTTPTGTIITAVGP